MFMKLLEIDYYSFMWVLNDQKHAVLMKNHEFICLYVLLSFAEDYSRLIEICDFPEGMITRDLLVLFREFKWVLQLLFHCEYFVKNFLYTTSVEFAFLRHLLLVSHIVFLLVTAETLYTYLVFWFKLFAVFILLDTVTISETSILTSDGLTKHMQLVYSLTRKLVLLYFFMYVYIMMIIVVTNDCHIVYLSWMVYDIWHRYWCQCDVKTLQFYNVYISVPHTMTYCDDRSEFFYMKFSRIDHFV